MCDPETGNKLKIKTQAYLDAHKVKTGFALKGIAKTIFDTSTWMTMSGAEMSIYLPWVKTYNKIITYMITLKAELPEIKDKKEFALMLKNKNVPGSFRFILFKLRDGLDLKEILLNLNLPHQVKLLKEFSK